MNENITSVNGIKGMIQLISSNLGIDVFSIFIIGFLSIVVMITAFKLPKETFPIGFLIYSILWVNIGLIPIWIIPFSMFFNVIIIVSKFRLWSNEVVSSITVEIPIKNYVKSEEPKTVNCKNCGGPNINQIKCEWCGLILE